MVVAPAFLLHRGVQDVDLPEPPVTELLGPQLRRKDAPGAGIEPGDGDQRLGAVRVHATVPAGHGGGDVQRDGGGDFRQLGLDEAEQGD